MATANGVVDHTKGVACFGGSCLLQLLGEHARGRENESTLKVGVVGKGLCSVQLIEMIRFQPTANDLCCMLLMNMFVCVKM